MRANRAIELVDGDDDDGELGGEEGGEGEYGNRKGVLDGCYCWSCVPHWSSRGFIKIKRGLRREERMIKDGWYSSTGRKEKRADFPTFL